MKKGMKCRVIECDPLFDPVGGGLKGFLYVAGKFITDPGIR